MFKKREASLGKQIDDLISEKKKLRNQLSEQERNSKDLLKDKNDQIAKYESSYRRYEEAIAKISQLEAEAKEAEDLLFKRHKEINSLLKENTAYKNEVDTIRRNYGSLDELNKKFELTKMKEEKINDLLDSLEHTMKSSENQLSCYRCMNILNDPVILSPCAHAVCRDCTKGD